MLTYSPASALQPSLTHLNPGLTRRPPPDQSSKDGARGRERDRERKPEERAELGRAEDSGVPGARKSCWGKVSPAIKQARPHGPWRAPNGQPIHIPRVKNRIKPDHPKVHTETCSGDPYITTHRDVQTQRSSNTPSRDTHPQICTHRQAYFTVPDRMSLPSALAHLSSNRQVPGAHA